MMEKAADGSHEFKPYASESVAIQGLAPFSKIAASPPYRAAFTRRTKPRSSRRSHTLQDEPAQIGVRGEVADVALDEIGVDADFFSGSVGGREAHLV
jgi:hypothetical protein